MSITTKLRNLFLVDDLSDSLKVGIKNWFIMRLILGLRNAVDKPNYINKPFIVSANFTSWNSEVLGWRVGDVTSEKRTHRSK